MIGTRFGLVSLTAVALIAAAAQSALAEEVLRQNFIPTGGYLFASDEQLGDAWSFTCPKGGTVTASVDTADDNDDDTSNVDPLLVIFDGLGNQVASADDSVACSVAPECGFSCPSVVDVPCGNKGPHTIVIVSAATNCTGGGQYQLRIEAFDSKGASVDGKKLKLGGGAKVKLPKWLNPTGGYASGPMLDDEKVPLDAADVLGVVAPAAAASRGGAADPNK